MGAESREGGRGPAGDPGKWRFRNLIAGRAIARSKEEESAPNVTHVTGGAGEREGGKPKIHVRRSIAMSAQR